jgi:acyl-CoA thioesterase II
VSVESAEFDESEMSSATVDELVEAITAREIDPGLDGRQAFETVCPDWWAGGRTFGGMVVAQALNAAMRTVPPELQVHSLHGYFLRPSRPGIPSIHTVEHLRDGRSFSTRQVITEVEGKTVFRMTCSFHAPEEGDEYQLPVSPGIPPPSAIAGFDGPYPIDVREAGATEQRDDGTYHSTRRCWFRTKAPLPDDPIVHACILAYLSDMTGAAFRPLSLGQWGTHTDASLDHALWFHRPWRADQWSIFELQALVNAGGRATVRATMHGEDGTLHLSMAQELLIRKLEVPLVFEASPWVDRDRTRTQQEGEASDGTA